MTKRQRVVILRFWQQWVLANAVGVAVGLLVLLAVGDSINDQLRYAAVDLERYVKGYPERYRHVFSEPVRNLLTETVRYAVGGAFGGAVLGFAQWLVLRRRIFRIGWWIPATIIGGAVGGAVGAVGIIVDIFLAGSVSYVIEYVLLGAVLGAVFGVAQWLALKRKINRAGWWIFANIVGAAVGSGVSWIVIYVVSLVVIEFEELAVLVVFFAIGGAVFGLITAPVIIWQLRKSTV